MKPTNNPASPARTGPPWRKTAVLVRQRLAGHRVAAGIPRNINSLSLIQCPWVRSAAESDGRGGGRRSDQRPRYFPAHSKAFRDRPSSDRSRASLRELGATFVPASTSQRITHRTNSNNGSHLSPSEARHTWTNCDAAAKIKSAGNRSIVRSQQGVRRGQNWIKRVGDWKISFSFPGMHNNVHNITRPISPPVSPTFHSAFSRSFPVGNVRRQVLVEFDENCSTLPDGGLIWTGRGNSFLNGQPFR